MDIFNENAALEKAGGNAELMRELLAMLVNELPTSVATLEQALQQEGKDTQSELAHKLKGSTAYCGVPALQEAATVLEQAIKTGQGDTAALLHAVKTEAERLVAFYHDNFSQTEN